MDKSNHSFIHSTCDDSQEDFFHVFVFVPSPLYNQQDPLLKVAKGWVLGHTFEPAINFVTSSVCHSCCLADEVVFEDPLMKLVVDIEGEAFEYVGVG